MVLIQSKITDEIVGIGAQFVGEISDWIVVAEGNEKIDVLKQNYYLNNEFYDLVFPDYEKVGREIYNRDWDGEIENWMGMGHPIKTYKTIDPNTIWNKVIESAWRSGEPGLLFKESRQV